MTYTLCFIAGVATTVGVLFFLGSMGNPLADLSERNDELVKEIFRLRRDLACPICRMSEKPVAKDLDQ